jgi:hypothetical protein
MKMNKSLDSSMELPDFDGGPDLMNLFLMEACNLPELSHFFSPVVDRANDEIIDLTVQKTGNFKCTCFDYCPKYLLAPYFNAY